MNILNTKWIDYYICDGCSSHSRLKFTLCPVCKSRDIRRERLPENYFQNAFAPEFVFIEYFLKKFNCQICSGTLHLDKDFIRCRNCNLSISRETFISFLQEGKIPTINPSKRVYLDFERIKEL